MIRTSPVFISNDFLLESDAARELYHEHASTMPIIDYHNHLSPKDIASNRRFNNLTELWLEGDHYKWRALRTNGVAEKFCTGNASPVEKFVKWAETVPYTVRNPLYHWTHLELKRYFDIDVLLDHTNAKEVYHKCSEMLHGDEFSVQSLLRRMNVSVVCTTDDPVDSLQYHKEFSKASGDLKMFPTFRPDRAFAANDKGYPEYLAKLSEASGISIRHYDDLISALLNRMDWFQSLGCRASDHGLEFLYFDEDAVGSGKELFKKVLSEARLTVAELNSFRCVVLIDLCRLYHSHGWVQQFYLGAMRNNNSRAMESHGPDTGFDSIGDFPQAKGLASFLNHLDSTNKLAKTILYNLNPADNAVFSAMIGNFNDGNVAGKIQYGAAWWFLDQKDGMISQINHLSNMGLISRFVGMVTDSRSFMSFPRHEYFRRILCNLFGNDIEKGELPRDMAWIGQLVRDISYTNAKQYFNF